MDEDIVERIQNAGERHEWYGNAYWRECYEAADTITGLRDRLAAKDALLERADPVIQSLCDLDVSYIGSVIHIQCATHGDAIGRIRFARATLQAIRTEKGAR